MSLLGPYVHDLDPTIGSVLGVHLWWYGLSYALGFLSAHLVIRRRRAQLGLSTRSAYTLSILLAGGVLLGGRFVEVAFYEWPFYRQHLHLISAYWLGGMATHGLMLGGLLGVWLFCRLHGKPFLGVADALTIPAALILGMGRLGNFIDGQIVGSVSTVCWAVKFPDAEGFRHPVVLYDGLKNLLLIPVLWSAALRKPPAGVLTGIFLFLYAFLRIFVDLFREYPTSLLGLATGQVLNILMSLSGLVLALRPLWSRPVREGAALPPATAGGEQYDGGAAGWQRIVFGSLLLFSLTLPSDWTQDIPARYGKRHASLGYSALYPRIDPSPVKATPRNRPVRAARQPAPEDSTR